MAVNAYSREGVVLTVAGIQITGFGEGDFLTVARPEDEATLTRGSHGEQTKNQMLIRDATAVLTMHAGSAALDSLQELLDIQRDLGSSSFPFSIADVGSNGRLVHSPTAFFMKTPDMTFGAEIGTVEWTIILPDCDIQHAGRINL